MKKDKEWLKAQVKDEERELKSVYDNYVPYEKVLIADDINELIDQLDEPELPVIPQFVADWIEINKNIEIDYAFELIKNRAKSGKLDEFDNWVNKNKKTFALAFIAGYAIEKETMYYVIFVESEDKEYGQALYKDFNYDGDKVVSTHIETFSKRISLEADNFHFSEQEIKAIDERYWAFREEVPNV